MSPELLLDSARRRVDPNENPTQEGRNRSVSDSYYALYHTLGNTSADLLVGSTPEARASLEWIQAYRALDHAQVKRQCLRSDISRFHPVIQDFAQTFCEFQEYRHIADYSPIADFTPAQTNDIIADAADVIAAFNAAPEDERRRFIIYVTLRYRRHDAPPSTRAIPSIQRESAPPAP